MTKLLSPPFRSPKMQKKIPDKESQPDRVDPQPSRLSRLLYHTYYLFQIIRTNAI
jgi:hypothetical protein